MKILPINFDNKNEWIRLWQLYLEFYETKLQKNITDLVFDRICDASQKDIGGYLAFEGEKAIGLVHYIVHKNTWSNKDVCYLEDLYVDQNVRGGGIGRALINEVANFARTNDLRHVYWQTQKTNKTAQILYEKMAGESEFIVYKLEL